jgi:Raf kinase inhibitor-like YbhB/YbcL family protein
VHWVLYNISGNRTDLPEGISKGDQASGIGAQGRNDFGFNGYGGPCPPPGKPHRYFFTLYALSKTLNLKAGMTKEQAVKALQGSILGETQLMGTFAR